MEGHGDESSKKAPGVSFTFKKKAKTATLNPVPLENAEKKEFVYSLEGEHVESSAPVVQKKTEYVIPLISKTQWRTPQGASANGRSGGDEKEDKASSEVKHESVEEEEPMSAEDRLEKEAVEAVKRDILEGKHQHEKKREDQMIPLLLRNKPPILEGHRESVQADVDLRPQPSSERDYSMMPIEEFGKAMIRGMGWKDGEAIGNTNKGLVEPIEYIGNVPGLGLGAIPKPPPAPPQAKIRKPGEQPKKVVRPYMDKDGRVRHIKKVGEEVPEQPAQGVVVGNYAKVIAGRHADLYGKIVMIDEDVGGVFLKLAINNQVERFSQHHLELVTREEYRLGRPLESVHSAARLEEEREQEERKARTEENKQYGLIRMKDRQPVSTDAATDPGGHPQRDSTKPSRKSDFSRHDKSGRSPDSKRRRTEEDRHRQRSGTKPHDADRRGERSERHCHSEKGENSRSGDRVRQHDTEISRATSSRSTEKIDKGSSHQHRAVLREAEPEEVAWLCRDLVVKIVDRQYKKGRHYNTKVTVTDMQTPRTCICQTADGHLLEGIKQNMLETVVPKASYSSVVKVVRGKRKGELGMVVEQDRVRATAVVQLQDSKEVLNVEFDDICQYVGIDADEDMM